MPFPTDYHERVYAGVLGKLIGVYLGRPFEGWEYPRIMAELGEISYYVHQKRGLPLIVTDDDISGTFTFIRALEDYDYDPNTSAAQIGQTWLNYLIEGKTILSWAGLGCSTEHTAYLRLKHGISAPQSGSIEMNGSIVAEQIGSQIFIDGWAMVAPGNPELAADLARRAASVSHDGEAIYGAQFLAAMEAQAFTETDRFKLMDVGLRFIPRDSHLRRMVDDLRMFHSKEPDWRKCREFIVENYGNVAYPGGCHIIPNSALIVLGLLYGDDDFQKSLMITNTSGWDTDCNSGNLGCLLGIKNGLAGIDSSPVDWRGPVADRMYLPSADGGRTISDAVKETFYLVNAGRRLAGESMAWPKAAASPTGRCRFHFDLPGSVQGFVVSGEQGLGDVKIENVQGHSRFGRYSLALRAASLMPGQKSRAGTATFIPPQSLNMHGYGLLASPTLYPGQVVRAYLEADAQNPEPMTVRLYLRAYQADGMPYSIEGSTAHLAPAQRCDLTWIVPDTQGAPIFEIGIQLESAGVCYLDALTWDGTPDVTFPSLPGEKTKVWRQAWVNGVQHWEGWSEEPYRIVQNEGRGMLITGTREWQAYQFSAEIRPAFLAKEGGIAVRVQGTRRFYGLLLARDSTLRLIKERDGRTVLGEVKIPYKLWQTLKFRLQVSGEEGEPVHLCAWVDEQQVFNVVDHERPLESGGVALVIEEGHLLADHMSVKPIQQEESK
ncbi:MAG: ADP-ribosylglycohydrolase family protein [Anaerolineae bacterium]|nr:ADP-ribosylglycohydrolase family protein [Anaerolineae bacterium]